MATATTMAIFLLVALSTSRIASSVVKCPGGSDESGCQSTGYLPGRSSGDCDRNNNPDCCADGQQYQRFLCSPPVSAATWSVLTVNSFRKGKDGGCPSECDRAYHDDSEMVVALSTGWFNGMSRCGRSIRITARDGTSVSAQVVDECDSMNGCDAELNYEKPCAYNIVDASPAVWNGLGLDQNTGMVDVTWSDQ